MGMAMSFAQTGSVAVALEQAAMLYEGLARRAEDWSAMSQKEQRACVVLAYRLIEPRLSDKVMGAVAALQQDAHMERFVVAVNRFVNATLGMLERESPSYQSELAEALAELDTGQLHFLEGEQASEHLRGLFGRLQREVREEPQGSAEDALPKKRTGRRAVTD